MTTEAPVTTETTTTATSTTTTTTTAPPAAAGLPPGTPYSEYELISDVSGSLEVEVPIEWADQETFFWDYNDDGVDKGPVLQAAPDIQSWDETWSTPGIFMAASTVLGLTVDELLDDVDVSGDCTYNGRFDYDDGEYRGQADEWIDCGDAGATFIVIATETYDGSAFVMVQVILTTDADEEALVKIQESFRFTP